MNESPYGITLELGLERLYGSRSMWPLPIAAAEGQLLLLKRLAPQVIEPALGCAVEASYREMTRPTRYDFLGVQVQEAFERRFGAGRNAEVDLAFLTCRHLLTVLGSADYQRVMSIAWEVSRCNAQLPQAGRQGRAPAVHVS